MVSNVFSPILVKHIEFESNYWPNDYELTSETTVVCKILESSSKKLSKTGFSMEHFITFQRFSWNFQIPYDRKSWFTLQLVRQLLHPLSGNNNPGLFQLWQGETLLTCENLYFVEDCNKTRVYLGFYCEGFSNTWLVRICDSAPLFSTSTKQIMISLGQGESWESIQADNIL